MSSTGSLLSPAWETHKTGPFVEVWKTWWNKKEKEDELIAGNVIELDSLFATTVIERTSGQLYIREHYIQVYQRLCDQAVNPSCGGVVLSGQPGTGKTYCLFFLLLKKLVKGEPVLFSRNRREVLYFSAGGVQLNENIASPHLLPLYPKVRNESAKTWALIDGDEGDRNPPTTALLEAFLFPVQAASPRTSRYKDWVKQRGGKVWSVARWSREDLLHAVKLAIGLPERSDIEQESLVDKAISKWGWAPRDIIKYLQGQDKELENNLTDALGALTSSQLFLRLKDRQGNSNNELSHILISSYASAIMEDTTVLDFKSLYIAHRVRQQLDILHRDDTLRFIGHCREHRESTALAGWAFENFVLEALTNAGHNDDLFTPIPAALSPLSPSSWSSTVSSTSSTPEHSTALMRVRFDKTLQDVALDGTKLYLPSQSNFPLLDAFYLVVDNDLRCVEVVVLQMTISLTHKGSVKGFAFLERLKDWLQSLTDKRIGPADKRQKLTAWRISFSYRLVVPRPTEDNVTFTWSFPGQFPASIAGPVSIQPVSSQVCTNFSSFDRLSSMLSLSQASHIINRRGRVAS
ncbi:hypothetical protein BDN71DRAFT_409947 [Pleurotus eryngii]|uniref:Uncharacterized protein n=1 Tax=Pleurotus eryngii TaxID=5323 RepID=A0A9P5ZK56_PLEER|nr:hypothetical protein BDN71DRAFT_409947 [Pleurotus eryngii]